jgi:tetratricopeptide (TPR) repeat protein
MPDPLKELLAALRARVEACIERGDASGVLEASALDQASELWLMWQLEPEPDLEVVYVLAWLHWCRYLALPEGLDREDRVAGLEFFEMVGRAQPSLVPPDVARILGAPMGASSGPSEDPGSLYNRGVLAFNDFQETGQRLAIDEALAFFHQAADRIPAGHPRRGMMLAGLGAAYTVRFEAFGHLPDLDDAITWAAEAVQATPDGNDDRPDALTKLGMTYLTRYQRSGNQGDLEKAIRCCAEAAGRAAGHPRGAALLSNAALTYRERFELAGDVADLTQMIKYAEAAWRATDADDAGSAQTLANLAAAYQIRFTRFGDPADLSRAVDRWQQAEATSTSNADRPVMLSALGLAFLMRFDQTGTDADLDKAVRYGAQAAQELPQTHAAFAGALLNCAMAYKTRFNRFQDRADLDSALQYAQRAVEVTPDGHPERAKYLGGLVGIYYALFLETSSPAYLDEAICFGREGAESAPLTHAGRGLALSDLGLVHRVRYEQSKAPEDLELAIGYGRDAVEVTPSGHPERALRLTNLSLSYRVRYELSGEEEDLGRALDYGTAAVDIAPADHPDRTMFLGSLALAYRAQFDRGAPAALDQAINCWREAVSSLVAPTHQRLTAAIAWGTACEALPDPAPAAEAFAEAVRLLPLLAWRGLERSLREKHLANAGGLVTDAAGWAIEAGNLENAVELLEQGRSVLWSQSLQVRTDLTRLSLVDGDLASRINEVRAALDRPRAAVEAPKAAVGEDELSQEIVASRQRELAREWDELVRRVRDLPGWGTFLAATPFSRLRQAASRGPVVVVNVSNRRCDALIMTAAGVRLRPLPGLTAQECARRANTLLDALHAPAAPDESPSARQEQITSMLFGIMGWLWDTTCEPVLEDLRDHGDLPGDQPDQDKAVPPRLWWCPTGPLTVLPLHAAGHYAGPDATWLSRTAVCSYTPTVEALLRSRERPQADTRTRILAVGMPTTPAVGDLRFADLPAVPRELDRLTQALPGHTVHVLRSPTRDELTSETFGHGEPQPTTDRVLQALPSHSWVHFACHGGQNLLDPSQGAVFLADGPLTVLRLAAEELPAAELAFLSACQTAVGGVQVPDETIHLAAALQFAGYRHVIATAWSISDSSAPRVASATYTELASTGSLDAGRAATAIHRAVEALRARAPFRPDLWAPYLHIGP